MKKFLGWLKNEESGQGMVEYGLIIGLIAVVVIAAIALLKDKIMGLFNGVALPTS
ncbi:MAG: Flp family type IVb pilin [Firmicutes bacterium HGW-Firmicutes-16]|nr:MAG: Flp family type IVb pilin [Firmicutes bacterium HGW-Firmicutes-16]